MKNSPSESMQSPATILRGSLGDIEKIPKWIPISEFVNNSVQEREFNLLKEFKRHI